MEEEKRRRLAARYCTGAIVCAGILLFVAGSARAQLTQLSLQLRRSEVDAVPPPEEEPVTEGLARFDRAWGGFGIVSGYFDNPAALAVDADEIIYVLDSGNDRVQRFDSGGSFLSKFGESGTRTGQFDDARGIAVDEFGYVYVVDTGNHRIQKLDTSGREIVTWGSLGSGAGLFNSPRDITFDEENQAYVADTGNDRIQKFTSSGRFIEEWTRSSIRSAGEAVFKDIVSLAYDDDRFGYLLVLSESQKLVQRFELDGDYQEGWPVEPGGECHPVSLETDNKDDVVFIADEEGNRILRFSKEGAFQGELTAGDEPFSRPRGLFVDVGNRRLYVVDTGNNRIQKFYMR